jgi:hypothetical protein
VVGPRHFRLVVHRWIDDADVEKAIQSFEEVIQGL